MMKDVDYYMGLNYEVVIEKTPDGEYFATVPDLPGCMATAETQDEARAAIEEAKYGWFEAALDSGVEIKEPPPERQYSGRILLRTSPRIHMYLVQEATELGLGLNNYINLLVTQNRCLLDRHSIERRIRKKEYSLREASSCYFNTLQHWPSKQVMIPTPEHPHLRVPLEEMVR
jgi:predicted RNase H-like HicB family nuclease